MKYGFEIKLFKKIVSIPVYYLIINCNVKKQPAWQERHWNNNNIVVLLIKSSKCIFNTDSSSYFSQTQLVPSFISVIVIDCGVIQQTWKKCWLQIGVVSYTAFLMTTVNISGNNRLQNTAIDQSESSISDSVIIMNAKLKDTSLSAALEGSMKCYADSKCSCCWMA